MVGDLAAIREDFIEGGLDDALETRRVALPTRRIVRHVRVPGLLQREALSAVVDQVDTLWSAGRVESAVDLRGLGVGHASAELDRGHVAVPARRGYEAAAPADRVLQVGLADVESSE